MTVSSFGPRYDQGGMLASTADRERALDVLKAGFAEGRLTKDEHDARVHSVYAARTYGELARLTGDLPGGQWPVQPWQQPLQPVAWRPAPPPWRPVPRHPDPARQTAVLVMVLLMLVALMVLLGAALSG